MRNIDGAMMVREQPSHVKASGFGSPTRRVSCSLRIGQLWNWSRVEFQLDSPRQTMTFRPLPPPFMHSNAM